MRHKYTTRIVAHFLTKEMSSICERTTAICYMMWDKKKKTNKLREVAKVIAVDWAQHQFSNLGLLLLYGKDQKLPLWNKGNIFIALWKIQFRFEVWTVKKGCFLACLIIWCISCVKTLSKSGCQQRGGTTNSMVQ